MPQNNTNEVRATAKYVRIAPRKARAVVALIRNLPVAKALEVLQFSTRAASVDVAKVLRSAIANAVNAQISQFTLVLSRRGVGNTTTPETTDPDPSTPEDPENPDPTDPGQDGDGGTPEGV